MRGGKTGERHTRKVSVAAEPFDVVLLIAAMALVAFGLVMSLDTVPVRPDSTNTVAFLKRQAIWAGIGFVFLIIAARLPHRTMFYLAKPLLAVGLAGLVLVLIPGIGTRMFGARCWLRIGPVGFQPSELGKLGLVIYLANVMTRKDKEVQELKTGLGPVMMVGVSMMGLVLAEPDFGMAALIAILFFTMLFIGGARIKHLAGIAATGVPIMLFLAIHEPYRLRRIMSFLNPSEDPQGDGWQLGQSLVALGSGGWWGKGLGMSMQKLGYLPQAYSDFVFSIVGEELGFVGAFVVVAVFALILWRGTKVAQAARDEFGHHMAMGMTVMICFQAAMHIGVAAACLPTTGISLPFVSLGGSSLVMNMFAVGLVLSVSRGRPLNQGAGK